MADIDIAAPAGYVPVVAIGYGGVGEAVDPVSPAAPLPVMAQPSQRAALAVPLAGEASESAVLGPFMPDLGRPIWLTLSGAWSGMVSISRSTDGGTTRYPLTYSDGSTKGGWSGHLNSPVGEESVAGASWFIEFTRSAGTLAYRLEQ